MIFNVVFTPTSEETKTSSRLSRTSSSTFDFPATALVSLEKKVVLVCEVAGDLWFKMFGPFLGLFGRFVEIIYLRFIYRNI